MKKSLLALIFAVALVVPAMAENMWVGGSFGYSSNNSEWAIDGGYNESYTSWSIEPEFGYSLDDKWDIGLDLAYASKQGADEICGVKIPFAYDVMIETTEMGVAPFARYHVAKIVGVDVILKGSAFYVSGEAKDSYGKCDYSAYGVSIAPVISYSINETWSINATLNFAELSFTHVEVDQYDGDKIKDDNFGFNLNDGSLINIGFSYHF